MLLSPLLRRRPLPVKLSPMRLDIREAPSATSDEVTNTGIPDRYWTCALVSTFVLALAVRTIDLGSKSVFADELASIRFAQLNWTAFWRLITGSEANMALYYVLLRFWIRISDNVAFVRFLSVIPAVATVPVIYAIGKRLFSRPTAIIASLLFSLNTFDISYSQAGRGYSLAVFLVTLSGLYFVESVQEADNASAIGYVTASTAAWYAHFFACFVFLSQVVALLLPGVSRPVLVRQVRLMSWVAVLVTPLVLFAAVHKTQPLFWVQHPTAPEIYHFFTYLSGSGLKFGLSLVALLVAGSSWWLRARLREEQGHSWPFAFLTLWFLLPVGMVLLLSHWKPVFSPRFLVISLPAFVLLVSEGLAGIRPRWAQYSITAVLVVSCLTALPSYYRAPGLEDWRTAARYLEEQVAQPDAIVIADPAYRDIFEYSFRHFALELPTKTVIAGGDWGHSLTGSDHVWLIFCHPNSTDLASGSARLADFSLQSRIQFTGVSVAEYVRSRPR